MTIILIYQTDSWHSFVSRKLIAAATTEKKRDKIIRKYLRDYIDSNVNVDKKTIAAALEQIRSIGQTQGLAEELDFEIDVETVDPNTIL